jgi:hypothetical protein
MQSLAAVLVVSSLAALCQASQLSLYSASVYTGDSLNGHQW